MISSGNNAPGQQFGDTTYTKVFVGGLAWETQKETMRKYFEQFGEILEAVVITDKNTGRSKGYGFVTFREPEAATRACVDAAPVIDGRRANCNLASLGVQRTRPSTPQHGGSRFRMVNSFRADFQGGLGTAYPSSGTFPHYGIHQGFAYNVYGYTPYLADYNYLSSYYNVYGAGSDSQYPLYGGGGAGGLQLAGGAFYPYFQIGQASSAGGYGAQGQGYGQLPQLLQYYSAATTASSGALPGFGHQHYGGAISPATPTPGITMALPAAAIPTALAPHQYGLHSIIPTFTPATVSAEPSSA